MGVLLRIVVLNGKMLHCHLSSEKIILCSSHSQNLLLLKQYAHCLIRPRETSGLPACQIHSFSVFNHDGRDGFCAAQTIITKSEQKTDFSLVCNIFPLAGFIRPAVWQNQPAKIVLLSGHSINTNDIQRIVLNNRQSRVCIIYLNTLNWRYNRYCSMPQFCDHMWSDIPVNSECKPWGAIMHKIIFWATDSLCY